MNIPLKTRIHDAWFHLLNNPLRAGAPFVMVLAVAMIAHYSPLAAGLDDSAEHWADILEVPSGVAVAYLLGRDHGGTFAIRGAVARVRVALVFLAQRHADSTGAGGEGRAKLIMLTLPHALAAVDPSQAPWSRDGTPGTQFSEIEEG